MATISLLPTLLNPGMEPECKKSLNQLPTTQAEMDQIDAEMDQISHAEDNLYNTEFKTCIFMALFNIS